jgi:hypothetical protein
MYFFREFSSPKGRRMSNLGEQAYALIEEEERNRRMKDEKKEMPEDEGRSFNKSQIRGS